jgi:two-component system, NarL family, sensor histidine kinase UhpB
VTNAVRHAQPKAVSIDVRAQCERVTVRVADDGVGLPADWAQRGRFGLRGLRERVAKLEGTFEVTNRAGGGVAVLATLPIATASIPMGAT